jgi:hypothetical protein
VLRLADDARKARAAMLASYDERSPNEFWSRDDAAT